MKKYGLIGYPLTHSFSATYFNDKFAREGIDASYINCPIPSIDQLGALLDEQGPFDGLNVTIPYKELIIPFLDNIDTVAAKIGSVNLVKVTGSGKTRKLSGYNTDAYGFVGSLDYYNILTPGISLVLGTGGASKAVVYALRKAGYIVKTVSRKVGAGDMTYADLGKTGLNQFDLVVNTTPLGMLPLTGTYPPVPYSTLRPSAVLYDLVYNPAETLFLKFGREMGCKTINGLKMLYLQAEEGWKIWQSANPL